MQDPSKSRSSASGAFSAAAAVIQLRLLEAYLALPSCAAYSNQHEALTKLCSRSLRTSAFTTGATPACLHLHQVPLTNCKLAAKLCKLVARPCDKKGNDAHAVVGRHA